MLFPLFPLFILSAVYSTTVAAELRNGKTSLSLPLPLSFCLCVSRGNAVRQQQQQQHARGSYFLPFLLHISFSYFPCFSFLKSFLLRIFTNLDLSLRTYFSTPISPSDPMVLQEEGWPLGLRPVNARIGLMRNREFNGSISFSTLLTGSPSCTTDSSSDLDTESTGSFFHDKSITLGSLIGVSSILQLSRRSTRRRTAETLREDQKICKSKFCLFSLCSKLSTDAVATEEKTPSLDLFLQAERRVANNINTRNTNNFLYGPDDFSSPVLPDSDLNSLFVDDQVAPQSTRRFNTELLQHGSGYGAPLFFSCLCGQLIE